MSWQKELSYILSVLPVFCRTRTDEQEETERKFQAIETEDQYLRALEDIEKNIHRPMSFFITAYGPLAGPWLFNKISQDFRSETDSLKEKNQDENKKNENKKNENNEYENNTRQNIIFKSGRTGLMASMLEDVARTAKNLAHQFGLFDIGYTPGSDPNWIRNQLTEIRIGLSTLAAVMEINDEQIGRRELTLFLHQDTGGEHCFSQGNTLVIVNKGERIARYWGEWIGYIFKDKSFDQFSHWVSWQHHSPMTTVTRQHCALKMAQKEFKRLVDCVDFASDQGEKAARRYRAVSKWTDDVFKGTTLTQTLQGWNKIKTGNRIAWSGHDFDPSFLKLWRQAERNVEYLFWGGGSWKSPAWLGDKWSKSPNEHLFCFFLGVGIESYVRAKIGYDSWNAQESSIHPLGDEAEQFYEFLYSRILPRISA